MERRTQESVAADREDILKRLNPPLDSARHRQSAFHEPITQANIDLPSEDLSHPSGWYSETHLRELNLAECTECGAVMYPGHMESKHPRRSDLQALVDQGQVVQEIRSDLENQAGVVQDLFKYNEMTRAQRGGLARVTRTYYKLSSAQFKLMENPEG